MRKDTSDNNSGLTQEGVNLARKVGVKLKSYHIDRVLTSPIPRAEQTAYAMGFAVDQKVDWLAGFDGITDEEMAKVISAWNSGFTALQSLMKSENHLEEIAKAQIDRYLHELKWVRDGHALLMASHGGIVDFPMMAFRLEIPNERGFSYCEGYIVKFENRFEELELLRNN